MSVRSSGTSTRPFRSRNTVTGGVTGVAYESMNDAPTAAIDTWRTASSGVSSTSPRPLVDVHDGLDVAITACDSGFESPGGEIVQVEVNPAVALRPPDQLVRVGQHAPVLRDADLAHLRRRALLEQRAHGAGACFGHTHPRLLVVARARDERDRGGIGIPE